MHRPAPPPPVLPYAVDRDAYGIVVERRRGCTYFAIPPVGRWRDLPSDKRLSTVLLGLLLAGTALGNVINHFMVPALIGSALSVAWAWIAWWNWRRWVVVVVTPSHVLVRLGLSPDRGRERRWPRGAGLSLALSFDATRLVVRKPGEEMVLLYLCPRPAANRRLLAEMHGALHDPPDETTDEPADAPRTASVVRDQARDLADAAIVGGMVIIVLWGVWAPALWLGVIPLAVIAGLRFGTQHREFWP